MTNGNIKIAILEATRFITKATELLQTRERERGLNPRESGAARRASMDLTRSLAAMRKA